MAGVAITQSPSQVGSSITIFTRICLIYLERRNKDLIMNLADKFSKFLCLHL